MSQRRSGWFWTGFSVLLLYVLFFVFNQISDEAYAEERKEMKWDGIGPIYSGRVFKRTSPHVEISKLKKQQLYNLNLIMMGIDVYCFWNEKDYFIFDELLLSLIAEGGYDEGRYTIAIEDQTSIPHLINFISKKTPELDGVYTRAVFDEVYGPCVQIEIPLSIAQWIASFFSSSANNPSVRLVPFKHTNQHTPDQKKVLIGDWFEVDRHLIFPLRRGNIYGQLLRTPRNSKVLAHGIFGKSQVLNEIARYNPIPPKLVSFDFHENPTFPFHKECIEISGVGFEGIIYPTNNLYFSVHATLKRAKQIGQTTFLEDFFKMDYSVEEKGGILIDPHFQCTRNMTKLTDKIRQNGWFVYENLFNPWSNNFSNPDISSKIFGTSSSNPIIRRIRDSIIITNPAIYKRDDYLNSMLLKQYTVYQLAHIKVGILPHYELFPGGLTPALRAEWTKKLKRIGSL
jgi:hypothetical protein